MARILAAEMEFKSGPGFWTQARRSEASTKGGYRPRYPSLVDSSGLDFVILDWNGTVVPFFGRPIYPGALSLLAEWRKEGIRLVVVSHAYQAEIEKDVKRSGLEVDEVHGCINKNPIILEISQRLGQGILLGDHPMDCRAALAAGIPFFQAAFEGQSRIQESFGFFQNWQELRVLLPGSS